MPLLVKTDGSFAALIKLVIMLMVLPLLQRVWVVGQAREHITIQLPAIKHLEEDDINNEDDLSLPPDHY